MGEIKKCMLCNSTEFQERKGQIRTVVTIKANKILECTNCSFVFLNDDSHIGDTHYENSLMHDEVTTLENWRNQTKDDDVRRFNSLKATIAGKKILEVGAGNCGFIKLSSQIADEAYAVEPEKKYYNEFKAENIKVFSNTESLNTKFDLVFSFHVIEHVKDPISFILNLLSLCKLGGKIYIETPNSNDALIKLYKSNSFQNFTYWDNHIVLFSHKSFEYLCNKITGIKYRSIPLQRYNIANHLYWLASGIPGGHKVWNFLNNEVIENQYKNILSELDANDTLFYEITKVDEETSLKAS
jgi:2-polyprenyl-3-methyl-5-hydroxy-6-metoxy-1,4-benzoquinol methylase